MLDIKAPVSLYYQLELQLRQEFSNGDLSPGSAIPGENELAAKYGVSRVTVRRALDRLEEDGLIIRHRGARTILSPLITHLRQEGQSRSQFRGFEEELRVGGMKPQADLLEATEGQAPESVAASLGLPHDETIVRIRRLGKAGNTPLWLESRFFPLELGRIVARADLAHESVLGIIRAAGYGVTRVSMHIRPLLPTRRQASILGIPTAQPLLLHESATYIEGDVAVQVVRAYLRGDLYSVTLQAQPYDDMPGLRLINGGYVVMDTSDAQAGMATSGDGETAQ